MLDYYPACACTNRGYVIGIGVHLHVCISMYVTPPKSLNGTLAVDSPFQTLVVDYSSNL